MAQKKTVKQQGNVQYTREQKGHSLVLHIFLCAFGVGFFTIPYYSLSPNHYWHI